MKSLYIFGGAALSMLGLWGGAWVAHIVGDGWQLMPAVMTASCCFFGGIFLGICGVCFDE